MEKDLGKICYEPPRTEIVELSLSDVIATSSAGALSNDNGLSYDSGGWV